MHQDGSHVQSRGKQITVFTPSGYDASVSQLKVFNRAIMFSSAQLEMVSIYSLGNVHMRSVQPPKTILRSRQIHVPLAAEPTGATGTGADFCLLPKITPGKLRADAYVWRLHRTRGSTARETDVLTIIAI